LKRFAGVNGFFASVARFAVAARARELRQGLAVLGNRAQDAAHRPGRGEMSSSSNGLQADGAVVGGFLERVNAARASGGLARVRSGQSPRRAAACSSPTASV